MCVWRVFVCVSVFVLCRLPEIPCTQPPFIPARPHVSYSLLAWQDIATIEERLDLVTFFLSSEGVFTSTLRLLEKFTDLDRMLGDLVTVPT